MTSDTTANNQAPRADARIRRARMGTTWQTATIAAVVLFLTFGSAGAPAFAGAQPPPAAQEGFVPVTDIPPEDQLPAAPLVIAAYAIAWIAVVVYLWSIWRRLSTVEREMAAVSRRLESGARR